MSDFPRLGIGCWQAAGFHGEELAGGAAFEALYQNAIELGFRLFDTAPSYGKGESEKLLGKVIRGKRERLLIASKFAPHHSEPKQIRWSLEQSLKNLGCDYIDILFQHWPSKNTSSDKTLECLVELKEEGKLRLIGVSNWTLQDFDECSLSDEIDILQNGYSPLWRHELEALSETLQEKKLRVFCHGIFGQGLLLKELNELNKKDVRRKNRFLEEPKAKELVKFFHNLDPCERRELCFAWSQRLSFGKKEQKATALVGLSNVTQLEQAATLLSCDLSKYEEATLELERFSSDLAADLAKTPYDSPWCWHPKQKVADGS